MSCLTAGIKAFPNVTFQLPTCYGIPSSVDGLIG